PPRSTPLPYTTLFRSPLPDDPIKVHQITTYPGKRLPHCWLNSRSPGNRYSTIDLAGHGRFTLLTGPGGQKWKEAARAVSESVGVDRKSTRLNSSHVSI